MNRNRVRHVVDTHHHVGSLVTGAETAPLDGHSDGVDPVATHNGVLDRFGMTACAAMPGLQYERPYGIVDTRRVNTAIAAHRDGCARVLAALGTVEPLHGLDLCREELDRMVGELHLDGVVWHTRYQGVAVADRRLHALVDEATVRGLPCFVHMFAESNLEAPWMFVDLAREHPEATIVALDGFSAATQIQYVMDLADRFDNILFDTAICFPLLRPLDAFVARFGSERLLFGTDSYTDPVSYNVPAVMAELLASEMDDAHLENVFWRTFCRVFPHAGPALDRLTVTRPAGGTP